MSTKTIAKTNKLISDMQPIISLLKDKEILQGLKNISINWDTRELIKFPSELNPLLKNYIGDRGEKKYLNTAGISLFGKLLIDIEAIGSTEQKINGKYVISSIISSGKNSVTFKAKHEFIGRNFVLKIIRPGKGENVIESLQTLGNVGGEPFLVHPTDFFNFEYSTITKDPISLKCIVFPFIEGPTLEDFLKKNPSISPHLIFSFLKQVSTGLHALEAKNLNHGDFHSNNILVDTTNKDKVEFKIIDISCGISNYSQYEHIQNDFNQFQQHLWRALVILQKQLPRMSLRKYLGANLFCLVEHILKQENMTFGEILQLLEKNSLFEKYNENKKLFLESKFKNPANIGLLRYEEFTDPKIAVELFEPYNELLDDISGFGNAIIYGHRGSGKSTYLASLACFPEIPNPIFNMKEKFGIFFACRQGEFKQFSTSLGVTNLDKTDWIKHIFILKIIRRVISTLKSAINHDKLNHPEDFTLLYDYITPFVSSGVIFYSDAEFLKPIDNLHAALLRNELLEIDKFFAQAERGAPKFLNERNLIDFFELIRNAFSELNRTQFYILFDDAGIPNVPTIAQKVINDILRCTNSVYCVKISAERFSYDFIDSKGKVLEETHDYLSFNISAILSPGSGIEPEIKKLESHFKKIINRRLQKLNYNSHDIIGYLGDKLIETDELVQLLSMGKRNAYYCGWNVVWQLAHRTPRHLIEIVSDIFHAGEIKPTSEVKMISKRIQHHAIVAFSEKKLKSLLFIPGKTTIANKSYGLGTKLYEFTASFGNIAKEYLRNKHVNSKNRVRFDERIAIERNDMKELSNDAHEFLNFLIRFAILDDSKLVYSRDDRTKKPIYVLNRIFCPAFGISFRRDTHLRLSKSKFESLLLYPQDFVKSGTKFLAEQNLPEKVFFDLFGAIDNE